MSEHHDLNTLVEQWAERAHSIFGPSSSAMYLTCLGSLIPHIMAPDSTSYEAAEGTVAHSVADEWLQSGERPAHRIGEVREMEGFHIPITDIMLNYLQEYVDSCNAEIGDHYYETRTDISAITPIPGQKGTADFFALSWQHMTIKDLKYGEGVKVYAAEDRSDPRIVIDGKLNGNSQGALYAVGVFLEWDWFYNFQTIRIEICQPRIDHFDVFETTREHLLAFMEWARERMAAAWVPGAPRTPSAKGCRWCRIEKTCPAQLAWAEDNISARFQDLDAVEAGTYTQEQMQTVMEMVEDPTVLLLEPIDPLTLTIPQLANVLRYRGVIEGWFKKIEAHIKDILEGDNDIEVPLWKLVYGRSNRKFGDQFAAEEKLLELGLTEDEVWKRKMISPNQAEELLAARLKRPKKQVTGLLSDYVIQPQGPRTLAPVNDKREEVSLDGDRFDNLDAEQSEDD